MLRFLDMLFGSVASPLHPHFSRRLAERKNVPSGALDQIVHKGQSNAVKESHLWVVDRILEPQTVIHFLEFACRDQVRPGEDTPRPLFSPGEIQLLQTPMSEWAPAPFNEERRSIGEKIIASIGSYEDPRRLIPISKELMAMKSRVWEGIMPLSERRWLELGLDSPENFGDACQFIASVINVFHYLNIGHIRENLRGAYNQIWEYLGQFDKALAGIKSDASLRGVSAAALWHDYIKEHYAFITDRSHRWVIDHIERIRAPVLAQLEVTADPSPAGPGPAGPSPAEMKLLDQIHDLANSMSQADSAIFLPMDGYRGGSQPVRVEAKPDTSHQYREKPITFSASTDNRKADYYYRVRYLSRVETWEGPSPGDFSSVAICRNQICAQQKTRRELRGDPTPAAASELWVSYVNRFLAERRVLQWGYVGYRTSKEHGDKEWEEFVTKFNTDIANWGSELQNIEEIRKLCKVEWRDIRDKAAELGDVVAAAQR